MCPIPQSEALGKLRNPTIKGLWKGTTKRPYLDKFDKD